MMFGASIKGVGGGINVGGGNLVVIHQVLHFAVIGDDGALETPLIAENIGLTARN